MKKQIYKDLLYIVNKAFCCYTYDRAYIKWKSIKDQIETPYREIISEYLIQIGNPDISPNGYGKSYHTSYQQACVGLKTSVDIYIHINKEK